MENLNHEEHARKKIQSLIKGWLLLLEEDEDWAQIAPALKETIRRAVIRAAWSSYKIGLLTPFVEE
jgi:hypothetical protein